MCLAYECRYVCYRLRYIASSSDSNMADAPITNSDLEDVIDLKNDLDK